MAAADGGIDGNTRNRLKTHDDSIQTLKFAVLHRNRFDTAARSGPCLPFRADAPSASRRRAASGPVRQRTAGFLMRAGRSGSVFDGGGDPIAATVFPGGGIGGLGTLALCDSGNA